MAAGDEVDGDPRRGVGEVPGGDGRMAIIPVDEAAGQSPGSPPRILSLVRVTVSGDATQRGRHPRVR
jgi:hypothetical protein